MLHLTVLGCAGSYAGPGNACSGYLVEAGPTRAWVDTGPGSLANLQRFIDLRDLDAVVISHAHPDHWLDLPVARNALKYFVFREGVPLYAPEQVLALADGLGHGSAMAPTFAPEVVADGDEVTIGELGFSFSRTDHPVETLAMRIQGGGRALAYSADTAAGWSVERLGPGIDAFLCEASVAPDYEGEAPHLTGAEAGAMARAAGVGRLLLTHIPPGGDEAARIEHARTCFDGPVEVVQVNTRYEL